MTIGLEIHIKLKSATKLFCSCANEQNFDTLTPNTHVCPTCTGQPGALPVLQADCLEKALLLGRAIGCKIQTVSGFDRKSYFYPDLPMGYQITQMYQPTCIEGSVSFFINQYQEEKKIQILQAHMETDTAKMMHDGGIAVLDFNRSGTPLVEIVTGPDFGSVEEVVEFLKELQRIVRYNNIGDADLEKGQMRVDVNLSIRPSEQAPLGTRVELKNINSFGMIKRAIEHEYARQVALLEAGQSFEQQTRGRDDPVGDSYLMRSKSNALDYRYFPEPDMPPLVLDDVWQERVSTMVTENPHMIIKMCKEEYGFHKEYINALISDKAVLDYFLAVVEQGITPKTVAKRIAGPISAYLHNEFISIEQLKFAREDFVAFCQMTESGKLPDYQAKIVMDEMLATGTSAESIVAEKGFGTEQAGDISALIQEIIDAHPTVVQQYKDGKMTTIGFFVGQAMKKLQGKANPQQLQEEFVKVLT